MIPAEKKAMCSIAWTPLVLDRRFVERGHVPEREVRRPDRERDEGVREHAQAHDSRKREHGAEQRPGQPGEQAQRREVAEQEVLRHVEREELLLGDGCERRGDRDDEEHDPEREEADPPPRYRLPAPGERSRPHAVRDRDQHDRGELERVERPAREQGRVVHATGVRLSLTRRSVEPRTGSG